MAETFQLEVATPERSVVDEQVTSAELPGKDGYMGVLAGHAPLLSILKPGLVTYSDGGGEHVLAIDGGFLEVLGNHVRVLADSAESAEDIQTDTARQDMERATSALHSAGTEAEADAALQQFEKAQARLDLAARKR